MMIGVTGATGQLGGLVIAALKARGLGDQVVALARRPEAVTGVQARKADYADAATLAPALAGVETLLLISSSEIGQRTAQHGAVIDAAKQAGVRRIAYTSILNADSSPLALAAEHRETEAALAASGLETTILRNGWYSENYEGALPQAVAIGTLYGAAGAGRFSTATRADYAEAAAAVLAGEGHGGKVYELAGDTAFTYAELAGMISEVAAKPVAYLDMPQDAYAEALKGAGLPGPLAELLADSDAGAAKAGLYSESKDLGGLIGRATTPMATTVAALLG